MVIAPSQPAHAAAGDERCAVGCCAEVLTGKWTLLVVHHLLSGPRSFSELESALTGISPNTLCDRLRLLAHHGLVSRTRLRGVPPRTIYSLTELGTSLGPLVDAMRDVGEQLLSSAACADDDA